MTLRVYERIVAHSLRSRPSEAVGLLAAASADPTIIVARRLTNAAGPYARLRYVVRPTELAATVRDVEDAGCVVAGLYHSHPGTPATCTVGDRRGGLPSLPQVIVSLRNPSGPEVRAWSLHGPKREAIELALRLIGPAPYPGGTAV